jgi:glycosyltransferase involved in cell wall biosynthesis
MKVSVITPSLNMGRFIEKTIESVRHPNSEHIVIDGGSTDNTLEILEDSDIYWVSEPDRGQSDAINKGFAMARGDIIAYLNADDTYLPETLDIVISYFSENSDVDLIYGDGVITDELGNNPRAFTCGQVSLEDLLCCRCNIFQPSVFMRKGVFDKIGRMDENLHLAMDLDYWIRCYFSDLVMAYAPVTLSSAKVYPDAKSTKQLCWYVQEYEYILKKHYAPKDFYVYVYTKGGLDYIHSGLISEGARYLMKAASISPVITCGHSAKLISAYLRVKS